MATRFPRKAIRLPTNTEWIPKASADDIFPKIPERIITTNMRANTHFDIPQPMVVQPSTKNK